MAPLTLTFQVYKEYRLIATQSYASQTTIKIGSLSSSHLCLADNSVSRLHAVIEVVDGNISLIDLGSTSGTYVNGLAVAKADLRNGDTIAIGEFQLELEVSVSEPSHFAGQAPQATASHVQYPVSQQPSGQYSTPSQYPASQQPSGHSPPDSHRPTGQYPAQSQYPTPSQQHPAQANAGQRQYPTTSQYPVGSQHPAGQYQAGSQTPGQTPQSFTQPSPKLARNPGPKQKPVRMGRKRPKRRKLTFKRLAMVLALPAIALFTFGLMPAFGSFAAACMGYDDVVIEAVKACPAAVEALGDDIRFGRLGLSCGSASSGDSEVGYDYGSWRMPIVGSKSSGVYDFYAKDTGSGWYLSSGTVEVDGIVIDIAECSGTAPPSLQEAVDTINTLNRAMRDSEVDTKSQSNSTSKSFSTTSTSTINGKSSGKAKVMEFYIDAYADSTAEQKGTFQAMQDAGSTSPKLLPCMKFAYAVYGEHDIARDSVKRAKKNCKKGFSVPIGEYLLSTFPEAERSEEETMDSVLKSVNRYGPKVGKRLDLVQFVADSLAGSLTPPEAAIRAMTLVAKRRKAKLACVTGKYLAYEKKYGAVKGIEKSLSRCK